MSEKEYEEAKHYDPSDAYTNNEYPVDDRKNKVWFT